MARRFQFPREVRFNRQPPPLGYLFFAFFRFFFALFVVRLFWLKKVTFFGNVVDFLGFPLHFLTIFGRFWEAWERFFGVISVMKSRLASLTHFSQLLAFLKDFSAFLKTLPPCRVACKMHGFRRVGKDEKMCNSTPNFSLIFLPKFA